MLLSLFCFNDFLHFLQYSLNDWCFLIFLFVPSLLPNAQKSPAAFELVNFFGAHVCITAVKTSNIFYLRLLWRKILFQVVTKCYRFLKNVLALQKYKIPPLLVSLTKITPVCKQNLCKHSLDETTLDTVDYNEECIVRKRLQSSFILIQFIKILKFSVYTSQVLLAHLIS